MRVYRATTGHAAKKPWPRLDLAPAMLRIERMSGVLHCVLSGPVICGGSAGPPSANRARGETAQVEINSVLSRLNQRRHCLSEGALTYRFSVSSAPCAA